MNAPSKLKPSPLEINNLLKSTVQVALKDINKKKSKSIMGYDRKLTITLALASMIAAMKSWLNSVLESLHLLT
jgi:hypothetical protein